MSKIKCPRCNNAGRSVASIHHAESASAFGDVLVSGFSIGLRQLWGLDFGIFRGTPPFVLLVLSVVFVGVLMVIGISCEPGFVSFLAQWKSQSSSAGLDQIQEILKYLILVTVSA
jgi:hypothetical protein